MATSTKVESRSTERQFVELDTDKCLDGIRREFRKAATSCKHSTGAYRIVITPAGFNLRTNGMSQIVRVDFKDSTCFNATLTKRLFELVTAEDEFDGYTVWFDEEANLSADNGDHREKAVFMLVANITVPAEKIKRNPGRTIRQLLVA